MRETERQTNGEVAARNGVRADEQEGESCEREAEALELLALLGRVAAN